MDVVDHDIVKLGEDDLWSVQYWLVGGGSVETIGKILPMGELYREGGNWDGEQKRRRTKAHWVFF